MRQSTRRYRVAIVGGDVKTERQVKWPDGYDFRFFPSVRGDSRPLTRLRAAMAADALDLVVISSKWMGHNMWGEVTRKAKCRVVKWPRGWAELVRTFEATTGLQPFEATTGLQPFEEQPTEREETEVANLPRYVREGLHLPPMNEPAEPAAAEPAAVEPAAVAPPPERPTFAAALSAAVAASGLSIAEFCKLADVKAQSEFYKWKAGKSVPVPETYARLLLLCPELQQAERPIFRHGTRGVLSNEEVARRMQAVEPKQIARHTVEDLAVLALEYAEACQARNETRARVAALRDALARADARLVEEEVAVRAALQTLEAASVGGPREAASKQQREEERDGD